MGLGLRVRDGDAKVQPSAHTTTQGMLITICMRDCAVCRGSVGEVGFEGARSSVTLRHNGRTSS